MGKLHKKITKLAKKHAAAPFTRISPIRTTLRNAMGKEKYNEIDPIEKIASEGHDRNYDSMHPLGTQAEEAYDAAEAAKAAAEAEANKPTIPIPDEEELTRIRRRQARRRTGRTSTILTDQERFGV